MGIYAEIVDHNELFANATTPPIIVNDFDLKSERDMEAFNDLIYTTYNDDSLEILPRCDCGNEAIKGEYNVGVICDICGTPVMAITERPLQSTLWITAPEGIDALINPEIWIILEQRLTVGKISILQWLTDPLFQVPEARRTEAIKKLIEMKMPRGLNHFIRNFDSIMDTLINGKIVKKDKPSDREELLEFLKQNRHALFSKNIPIPSKLALIKENTPMGVYADKTMRPAIEAIRTISSVSNAVLPLSQRMIESRTVRATMQLAEYYTDFFKSNLSPKEGWYRRHVYGSRSHFSMRAVISSISHPHDYEEVFLPWSLSIQLFKIHLTSKLLREGYTPNQAIEHINEHTLKYSIVLDRLFQELIAESPHKGIPILLNRNPTLTRGSIQQLFVTKVMTDVNVNTLQLSVLILASFNADKM